MTGVAVAASTFMHRKEEEKCHQFEEMQEQLDPVFKFFFFGEEWRGKVMQGQNEEEKEQIHVETAKNNAKCCPHTLINKADLPCSICEPSSRSCKGGNSRTLSSSLRLPV